VATLREILEARNEIALEGPIDLEKLEKILAAKRQEKREKKKTARPQPQQSTRKNYMNRAEREEFMILAAMAGKLEEIIENWVNLNRPKDRIKWARTSLTFLYKAMDDCVKGIPLETIAQIVREVGLCTIGVIEYEPRRR
jgi:uncharacterized protein YcbK (DUF882 family)